MRKVTLLLALILILAASFKTRMASGDEAHKGTGNIRNVSPLQMTDVSPDADFGILETDRADPGGRIVSLVIDPTNPLILYAASEMAGVWKSIDGAHHWKQASTGLRTGMSQNYLSLAIDAANPKRLLYVTQDDDRRPGSPYGGLWASNDGAASWQQAVLPNCSPPSISSVAFASGQPFVAASCGIATTTDATLGNATWTLLPQPPFDLGGAILATSPGSPVLFACTGPQVFRSRSLGAAGSWSAGASLVGACSGLAVTPDDPTKALAVHGAQVANRIGVSLVDMDVASGPQVLSVGTQLLANSTDLCQGSFGSGAQAVFAARRPRIPGNLGPGHSYDVFLSSGCIFYAFKLVGQTIGRWEAIAGTHVDTHSMAIASTYDPNIGPCPAYLASDGGVFALTSPFPRCDPAVGWVRAMSGLHVMYSDTMAGVSRPQSQCPDANQPCPALYLPTGDNDVWVSMQGGLPGSSWKLLGDSIGDAAIALVDPALPSRVVVARNQNYKLVTSSNANPPDAGAQIVDITPLNASTGGAPPGIANLVQIMTMPSEAPSELGDYLAVSSPGGSSDDVIVQNTSGTASGWSDISPSGEHFGPGQIGAIAASNGHKNTVYYVLASPNADYSRPPFFFRPGKVYKSQFISSRRGIFWNNVSNGISKAYNLYVDPYDPLYLYVTDLDAQAIKSSSDGGKSWQVEKDLTDIATNYGEFRFDCGAPAKADGDARSNVGAMFAWACGLQQVVFDRNHPEIRVAAVWPGGVAFSRDRGKHWMPLDVTNNGFLSTELYQLPYSLFYDPSPNPATKAPSLYIALNGGSLKRVDGPFPSLMSSQVGLCPLCVGSQTGGRREVIAVVDTLDARLPLRQAHDKFYRGRLLFDSARVSTLSYHFEVNGRSTAKVSHTLSDAERSAGVFTITVDKPISDTGWLFWLMVTVLIAVLLWLAYRFRSKLRYF